VVILIKVLSSFAGWVADIGYKSLRLTH